VLFKIAQNAPSDVCKVGNRIFLAGSPEAVVNVCSPSSFTAEKRTHRSAGRGGKFPKFTFNLDVLSAKVREAESLQFLSLICTLGITFQRKKKSNGLCAPTDRCGIQI